MLEINSSDGTLLKETSFATTLNSDLNIMSIEGD